MAEPADEPELRELSIALDWTPNTNHTGLYVAQAKGFYRTRGLTLRIISRDDKEAPVSPAVGVCNGTCTFGMVPSDVVLSHHCDKAKVPIVSILAVLQEDVSAVCALTSSGIHRPRQLDGRSYASGGYPLEVLTVQQVIQTDGGKGDLVVIQPELCSQTEMLLLRGEADSAWMFRTWESLRARRKGASFVEFPLTSYNIPFSYMITLVAHPDMLTNSPEVIIDFLAATVEG